MVSCHRAIRSWKHCRKLLDLGGTVGQGLLLEQLGMTQARAIPKANEKPMKIDVFIRNCSQSCSCVGTTCNKMFFFFTKAVIAVINGEESHCVFSVSQSSFCWRCMTTQGGEVSSEATCFLLLSSLSPGPHHITLC